MLDREAWGRSDVYRRITTREARAMREVVGYVDDPQERSKLRLERVRIAWKLRSDEEAAGSGIVDEIPPRRGDATRVVSAQWAPDCGSPSCWPQLAGPPGREPWLPVAPARRLLKPRPAQPATCTTGARLGREPGDHPALEGA
jgi:hypothetical protein